jgi:hypothetical protein
MICDVQSPKETLQNDVIHYYNGKQNTDIINYYNLKQNNESFSLKGDIEEGLGEYDAYNSQIQKPNICKSNYLVFELISSMSYKFMKNMKQIVSKQINYFCPSKKKMENYL